MVSIQRPLQRIKLIMLLCDHDALKIYEGLKTIPLKTIYHRCFALQSTNYLSKWVKTVDNDDLDLY